MNVEKYLLSEPAQLYRAKACLWLSFAADDRRNFATAKNSGEKRFYSTSVRSCLQIAAAYRKEALRFACVRSSNND